MNPAIELRSRLSTPKRHATGAIVERVAGDRYRVSVPGEVIEAIASSAVAFLVGDYVSVRDGVIIGRVRNPSTLKTYSV